MARKLPRLLWLAAPAAYLLYFFRLSGAGLIGPDEPRYAWIGRAMAQSGDWVTPRLWGQPWFEKPALLYWMTGAAFRLGLGPELAPRLPVALLSVTFLVFYWWALEREFGCRAAWIATAILGGSAAWIGFSQAAAPDLPLTATFSAAMLLALPWVARRDGRYLPAAAALLGAAALAKGLVPLALAAPLALRARDAKDLIRARTLIPFFAVAAPWYALCYMRNGWPFLQEFFLVHHFGRFSSGALLHGQPWWFYLTRLPLLLLPWAPLLAIAMPRAAWRDPSRRFLAVWALFGLGLFSASANKLPGYALPLLPPLAALAAVALHERRDARAWLAVCAALLTVFPVAGPLLPAAAANEWEAAPRIAFHWTWLWPMAAIGTVLVLESRGRRAAAVLTIAACTALAVAHLKVRSEPELRRLASARALAGEVQRHAGMVCSGELKRDWQYGLSYYLGMVLPSCDREPKPFRVLQLPRQPPALTGADAGINTASAKGRIDQR